MPLKLLSPGGGSVLLQANTTSLDYTLTVPAVTANVVTTGDSGSVTGGMIASNTVSVGSLSANASSIGVGQTWQDVLSSRAVTTEYRNTTGKPIMVNISFVTPFTSRLQLQVSTTSGSGYVIIADSDGGDYYSASQYTTHYATISAIIPHNHYYKAIAPDNNATLMLWAELR